MRHEKMQEYVNVNWNETMSILGIAGDSEDKKIIAEGRYIRLHHLPHAELALLVDEAYQSIGVCTYLLKLLMQSTRSDVFIQSIRSEYP